MAKEKYKKKRELLESIDPYDLDGQLSQAMQIFEKIIIDHPSHSDFTLDWNSADSYGEGAEYAVWGERLETEVEYQARLRAEKKVRLEKAKEKARSEAQQRNLYEKLKKKFEAENNTK